MEAFDLGADDYLVKPFHLKELSAKRACVPEARRTPHRGATWSMSCLDIRLDPNRKIVVRAGREIDLTPQGIRAVGVLAQKQEPHYLGKTSWPLTLWDANYGVTHNTIEVYINFLRNKIRQRVRP